MPTNWLKAIALLSDQQPSSLSNLWEPGRETSSLSKNKTKKAVHNARLLKNERFKKDAKL